MNTVFYTSPFVPPEWIESWGFRPSRLVPEGSTDGVSYDASQGMCRYMWRLVHEPRPDAAGVVFTTICDQMRRAGELTGSSEIPVFIFHVPKAWQNGASFEYYLTELGRLGEFLHGIGGRPSGARRLIDIMRLHEGQRRSIMALRGTLSPRSFSETLLAVLRGEPRGPTRPAAVEGGRKTPLLLVGGPLTLDGYALFDEVERAGGEIVVDGTENGVRTLPSSFDAQRIGFAPMRELARAYFGTIPDAFRRPNDALYRWLREAVAAFNARGIVLIRHVWCDIWHAEVHRVREVTGLPVLDIGSWEHSVADRNRARMQAFIEMLR